MRKKLLILKKQNNLKDSILICGSGRWSKVHINEVKALNFNKIFIYSQRNILDKKKFTSDRFVYVNKLSNIDFKNLKLITLVSYNKNNYYYLKKLNEKKCIILIEKPIIFKNTTLENILKAKKGSKIYLSMPWLYDDNLKKISKLIKLKKIKNIKFLWYSNLKKRYGYKRKFDTSISFSQDIISHIISILSVVLKNKNLELKIKSRTEKEHYEYLDFIYNKYAVKLACNRNHNTNMRRIVLNLYGGENYLINIGLNNISFYHNSKLIFKNSSLKNNIIKQYKDLLSTKSKCELRSKKNLKKINSITNNIIN